LGLSLSWILFEEKTPRLMLGVTKKGCSGRQKKARGDISHPVLPSDSEASLTSFGTASQGCQKGGSGGALSRLGIAKKVIWDDEILLEIRDGLKEAFHGLKGQGL